MSASPLDAKEQVRQATDIVELVGQYLQLRRQGRNYVALCPWHDDTRPSLQVNPERQSFKCWVCDIGGDVFSFMMQIEGVEFREALEMLAERANIPLRPQPKPKLAGSGREIDKQRLFRAAAWVEQQYHDCLLHDKSAEPARKYLDDRGITPEAIRRFHIGFAPLERGWLQQKLRERGGDSNEGTRVLETIGVLARSASGTVYERFRGRLLFSIRDAQGRPIGLGGRLVPGVELDSPAKYLNSPESPLFTKNRLLYGLDLAREPIRRGGQAIVVEGYTDVVVAHQQGFDHTVAVLGTALGENHVRLLRRYADRIVLLLDGDEAGQRRAAEVLELFIAAQADLRIVTLPSGMDPCDYLLEHGAAALAERIDNEAVDAPDHAFHYHTRGIDLARDVHAASEALERLLSLFARSPRLTADTPGELRLREQKVLQRIAADFRLPEEEVRRRLSELRRKGARDNRGSGPQAAHDKQHAHDRRGHGTRAAEPTAADLAAMEADAESGEPADLDTANHPAAQSGPAPVWQRELVELIVVYPELITPAAEVIATEQVTDPVLRRVYETACRLAATGDAVTFDRLTLEFDEPRIQSLLVDLDETGRAKGSGVADPEALLTELLQTIEREQAQRLMPAQIARLREGGLSDDETAALLGEIAQQARHRHGISPPTDG